MSNFFDPDMIRDGEQEYRRLKKKIKDYVKNNLRDYLFNDSVIGRKGKKLIQIPITGIRLPSFERDRKKGGGIGQGPGETGDPLPGQGQEPGKGNQPGKNHADHENEVEIIVDDLVETIQEILELPNIEEKGKRKIVSKDVEYTDLRKTGPECLLDVKRTIKNTLIRILCGAPHAVDTCPEISIEPDDRVYKTWRMQYEEHTNAVIIAMRDISGSISDEQKKMILTTQFWIEKMLEKQYSDGVEFVYLVHDTEAEEVSYHDFFTKKSGGGTAISSVLELANKIIDERFPPKEWNIYPFFFSDGDNQSSDNEPTISILEKLIDKSNQICYGQVNGENSSPGELYKYLLEKLGQYEKLCVYEMKRQEDIISAIKKFLSRGR